MLLFYLNTAIPYLPDDLDFEPMEEEEYTAPSGKYYTIPSIDYKMVYIPPGEFMMGSPKSEKGRYSNEKLHRVRITRGFYMGVTEVTQAQWKKIMDSNPSYFEACDDCLVENVSWWDVQEFISRLNEIENTDKYRLPTEAEWEYACRAGTNTAYYWGDDKDRLDEYVWYGENSGGKTHPVAQKKPNSWGLYDMLGNVWEWCLDIYTENYPDISVDDPVYIGKWVSIYRKGCSYIYDTLKDKGANRVIRGGCWFNFPRNVRCASRYRDHPGIRLYSVGFRLLCPVK